MMQRWPKFLRHIFAYLSIYPLLIFIVIITGPACGLALVLTSYTLEAIREPAPTQVRRFVRLPVVLPTPVAVTGVTSQLNPEPEIAAAQNGTQPVPQALTPTPLDPTLPATNPGQVNGEAIGLIPDSANQPVDPNGAVNTLPTTTISISDPNSPLSPTPSNDAGLTEALEPNGSVPTYPSRPVAAPTSDLISELVSDLLAAISEPEATPVTSLRIVTLPSVTPTPTSTDTPTPTFTPTPTDTPLPTTTPLPTATPAPTNTPIPTNTPAPPPPPPPTPVPPPVVTTVFDSAVPAPNPGGGPDFMLAEFFNSPTSNSFLVIYVAIVDPNEIPIGDIKVVGTRLDHNLTYESPLSTWHYEGYNAPGEVIKSGNVKFEPPGGIETTSWVLHLEDPNGNRLSDEVPFDTNQEDKQWYFLKFRRRF